MKDYIIVTNYGYTYKISSQKIAEDYASCALQFQEQDGVPLQGRKTSQQFVEETLNDPDFIDQWYYDQIDCDHSLICYLGEVIHVDEEVKEKFFSWVTSEMGTWVTK